MRRNPLKDLSTLSQSAGPCQSQTFRTLLVVSALLNLKWSKFNSMDILFTPDVLSGWVASLVELLVAIVNSGSMAHCEFNTPVEAIFCYRWFWIPRDVNFVHRMRIVKNCQNWQFLGIKVDFQMSKGIIHTYFKSGSWHHLVALLVTITQYGSYRAHSQLSDAASNAVILATKLTIARSQNGPERICHKLRYREIWSCNPTLKN